jgi:radical SAM enzyme (TIGR01210 family)
MIVHPDGQAARDRFVTSLRPPRPAHDVSRAHGVVVEDERTEAGAVARVATVFLTGRECPWRCAMCDLWQYTTEADTPPGAIAAQVTAATRELGQAHPDVTRIKLYNAGSFFDPRAVPPGDYDALIAATRRYERVIVESHPTLIGARTIELRDALVRARDRRHSGTPVLEIAMGLETVHPLALDRINKKMSVDDFRRAASALAEMGVALRVFLLVSPPFVADEEQDAWLVDSVDTAFACGASVVSIIPTRHGNGAMDALRSTGAFTPPHLADLERSIALALDRPRHPAARVFADLWDLDRFATCPACLYDRRERLRAINLEQRVRPPVSCVHCGGDARR